MQEITLLEEIKEIINTNDAVLVYFSLDACAVCHVLQPKLEEAISSSFPKIKQLSVNIEHAPTIAGQYSIFTSPVVLVYFQGKEFLRKAQSFGVSEIAEALQRPYNLIFD